MLFTAAATREAIPQAESDELVLITPLWVAPDTAHCHSIPRRDSSPIAVGFFVN